MSDTEELPRSLYGFIEDLSRKRAWLRLCRYGSSWPEWEFTVPLRRIPPRWRHQGQYLWVCFNRRGRPAIKFRDVRFTRRGLKASNKRAAELYEYMHAAFIEQFPATP